MNKSKQLREVIEVSMKMRQVKLAENIEVLTGDNYSEVIDSILESDIVKELLSPQDEWVSVEERLPELNGWVLGCVIPDDDELVVGEVDFDVECKTFQCTYGYNLRVTHWQPLPTPPQTEE